MLNTENTGPPRLYMQLKRTAGNRNAIMFGGKEYEKSREKSCRLNRIRNERNLEDGGKMVKQNRWRSQHQEGPFLLQVKKECWKKEGNSHVNFQVLKTMWARSKAENRGPKQVNHSMPIITEKGNVHATDDKVIL